MSQGEPSDQDTYSSQDFDILTRDFERSATDITEDESVDDLFTQTCGCKLAKDGNCCSSAIDQVSAKVCRFNCLQLTKDELDLVILGQLQAHRTKARLQVVMLLDLTLPFSFKDQGFVKKHLYSYTQCPTCDLRIFFAIMISME